MNKSGNSTLKRIISAVLGLPIYLFLIITDSFQSIPILLCSTLISLICLFEFFQISDRGEHGRAFVKAGMITGIIINIIMYVFAFGKIYGYTKYIQSFDARVIMCVAIIFTMIILSLQLFTRPLRGGVYSISVTIFGLMYIVLFFSHIILIKALANGLYYLIMLNVVIMINDVAAYFGGIYFGKHKTKFPASPNKSWEGYFSGLLFSIIGAIITNQVFISFYNRALFSIIEAALIGIFLGILGSIGDLVESAVKRDGSIKDSGSIIPGHGGMWDVFDAMIFTMPIFYYALVMLGIP